MLANCATPVTELVAANAPATLTVSLNLKRELELGIAYGAIQRQHGGGAGSELRSSDDLHGN